MALNDIDYICKHMLNLDWRPEYDGNVLKVISKCDSKLEKMFILGACYFIDKNGEKQSGISPICLSTHNIKINNKEFSGIWVVEPWNGWYLDEIPEQKRSGPSALLLIPQYYSPEKEITHDMAIFYGDDNGSPKWSFKYAIEIDGYGTHYNRRNKDKMRDAGLTYPVIRLFEETDKPLDWFRKIVLLDADTY